MLFSNRQIAILSALAALSASLQLLHVGYQSPQWGMWLDFVSVSWIIAFFLFNLRAAFIVSVLGAIIITLFAPETWLGASMKWLATAPMWLSLYFFRFNYSKWTKLILPLLVGLTIRLIVMLPVNYYYAIPIWTGMPPAVALKAIPWYIIAGFNTAQGLIDVIIAWILVYRFRLSRYAGN